MSTSVMLPSMALASAASFAGPRRSALRGRAVVPRAVSEKAEDDVASSSGTPSRRGVLFGSLAAAIALPAVAATEARPMSPVDAFITLMDGRDALTAAMELRGTEGGKRMRIKNLLPRYSDKAKTMTAALPAAAVAAFGEVVAEDGTTSLPPARMGTMEDILIGAKNLATLAAYVADDRPFEDADIPQETFAIAVRALDDLLASGSEEDVRKASAERCRRLLAKAADMDEMRTFASSPACNNI
jgi:hypothetical protein